MDFLSHGHPLAKSKCQSKSVRKCPAPRLMSSAQNCLSGLYFSNLQFPPDVCSAKYYFLRVSRKLLKGKHSFEGTHKRSSANTLNNPPGFNPCSHALQSSPMGFCCQLPNFPSPQGWDVSSHTNQTHLPVTLHSCAHQCPCFPSASLPRWTTSMSVPRMLFILKLYLLFILSPLIAKLQYSLEAEKYNWKLYWLSELLVEKKLLHGV